MNRNTGGFSRLFALLLIAALAALVYALYITGGDLAALPDIVKLGSAPHAGASLV